MAFSTTLRYTGLSGVDTASMVEALMEAESLKYDTMYQKNTLYSYKQEKYQSVGNALYNIQKNSYDILATNSLRKASSYRTSTTSVVSKSGSTSSAVSVKLGSSAKNFNSSVAVEELATSQSFSFTGSGFGKKTASEDYNLDNLTYDDDGGASINVSLDGTTKTVKLSADQINNVKNGTSELDDELNSSLETSFGSNVSLKASFELDSDGKLSMVAQTGHTMKVASNMEGLGFGTSAVSTAKTSSTTMGDMFGVTATSDAPQEFVVNGHKIEVTADMTVDKFISKFNDIASEDATMSYNSINGSVTVTAVKTGMVNKMTFGEPAEARNATGYLEEVFGSASITAVSEVEASDAKVYFDGSTDPIYLENNSMTLDDGTVISFNETTIEKTGTDADGNAIATASDISSGTLSVSTSEDLDHTKSMIQLFVDTYNSLLTTIYDETKTSRPTSSTGSYYSPLTEDQSAEMSSTEIEKWEEKSKTGVLYKDSDLTSIERQLRNVVQNPITLADGTTFKLSDIGISLTSDYSKGGLLSIDEDKLTSALESMDIDNITEGLSSYSSGLYTTLNSNVGMNGTLTAKVGLESSPLYMADNVMTNRVNDNAQALADLLERLEKKEERYYEMFSYMEESISNSNSQLAALGLG